MCLRILGDRAEAEDALQDTYLTVWRNARAFDPERASPITWLAALARNRAIDRRRSLGSRATEGLDAAAEVADPTPDAESAIGASQERTRLTGCIGELEARQADAIRSSFLGGATYAELAERRAVPLGTMKSWVRRGLLQLKACLGR